MGMTLLYAATLEDIKSCYDDIRFIMKEDVINRKL